VLKRAVPLPCAKHGDPAQVHTEQGALWLGLFSIILPYNHQRQQGEGEAARQIGIIDANTVKLFCDEIGLDFLQTFERLTRINAAYQGIEHED